MRVDRDGPWLTQLCDDEHFSLAAIPRGHRDALVARVGPVDVLMNPVNSQALGRMERLEERELL